MMQGNPQLMAIAVLVRKFGTKIPGGGYEVVITQEEMANMSQWGMFQEHPDMDLKQVRWQYYPQNTIEGELVVPEDAGSITLQGTLTEEGEKQFTELLQSPDKTEDTRD